MDKAYGTLALALALALAFAFANGLVAQQTAFPAIIIFGDSSVDVGNNNHLPTSFKANYPPYGRDFINHKPTGRFSNGKLATDFTAEFLGFKTYAPAYLSPAASGKNLLVGANFASAASGYDDRTAVLNKAIPLSVQLKYFKEYQTKLAKVAGNRRSASILKNALYILSTGTADFFQNYYVNPAVNKVYTSDQYGSHLVAAFSGFVKELYGLGARRLGVTSLFPLGCPPEAHILFGFHQNGCVSKLNTVALHFNHKLNSTAMNLRRQLPGLKMVVFDIFKPFEELVNSPSTYGFVKTRSGCCKTKATGNMSALCRPELSGTCTNASEFVFWDSAHPSQAANKVLAEAMLLQGIPLLS